MVEKRRKQFLQTPQGLGLVFAVMVYSLLSLLWFSRPDVIGAAFHKLRMIESLGTWPLWSGGWDQVFAAAATYRPSMAAMAAASAPFGLVFAVIAAAIGAVALVRVNMDHLDSLVASDKPKRWRAIMAAQSHRHPANRFFLDYDLAAMPLDRGPGRMPEKALDLLERTGAIAGLIDAPVGDVPPGVHAGPDLTIQPDRAAAALREALGPANPFLAAEDLQAAVAALPWPAAILIRTALERVAARDADSSAEAFADTIAAVGHRMDDVWRHLNALKVRHGDRLVLGLDGDGEEARRGEIITLAEAMKTDDPSAGDRRWLLDALAPNGDHPELLAHLRRNHFLSGCLATVLVETRTAGIFPPESFRWLRFVDYPLWSFLRTVGAPACAPVAAGAHAHWLAEQQAGLPLSEPQFTEAFRALRVEARKYLTDDAMRRLRQGMAPAERPEP